ncbi:Uu.00g146420.m01.CDS01 [Anthostomella pinea]|uniref:Uu.00g146420.m01.CDS01 n=1 Tax=Anthostomella pinea TaxID=933095 RepID=A0AAI8YJJ6_9PEZI|nr:Uu.00g146420.m01.CDS01 [Anthostomella pinea]
MSSRTRLSFDVKLNELGQTITIQIADPSGLQADNLALATWGSSEILANVLNKLPRPDSKELKGSGIWPVLELGAGTGLVGISAAAIWQTDVCLTDLEPLVPNLEANCELNHGLLGQLNENAMEGVADLSCGILDWAKPEHLVFADSKVNSDPARIIIAADTVYSEEHPELLTKAVSARLDRDEKARFIMCYPLRIGYLDHIRDLWERLEQGGLECVQEGREKLGKDWGDNVEEDVEYEWCAWSWKAEMLPPRG